MGSAGSADPGQGGGRLSAGQTLPPQEARHRGITGKLHRCQWPTPLVPVLECTEMVCVCGCFVLFMKGCKA